MKTTKLKFFPLIILTFLLSANLFAQKAYEVPLSNPDEPGMLKVNILQGGIDVTGYDGNQVLVTVVDGSKDEDGEPEYKVYKGRKLKRINGSGGGFHIEEDENTVQISADPWAELEKIVVKVPENFSVSLSTNNDGDIKVENVSGEIDVNNLNGRIDLINIQGPVVAHALNDDIRVRFTELKDDTDMSITSLNGDIEITFPDDTDCNLFLKTDNGEILSDFPISLKYETKVTKGEPAKGRFKLDSEKRITGKIGDGGGELRMQTMNGDIIILKEK